MLSMTFVQRAYILKFSHPQYSKYYSLNNLFKMIFVIFLFLSLLGSSPINNQESLRVKLLDAQKLMGFDQVEFDRLWNLRLSHGRNDESINQAKQIDLDKSPSTKSANPVACRYRMGAKNWSHSVHTVPYDIRDFCEGIGNYSNGMIIIAPPGYYQVNASLADVALRIPKKSSLYSYGSEG